MKRIRPIAGFALVAFLFSGCVTSNPYYVKKPSEVRANGKRILYLPVFLGKSFFPTVEASPATPYFDKKFQESVRKGMAEVLPTLDLVALAVLRSRDYFEIIEGQKDVLGKLPPEITRSEMFLQIGTQRTFEWFHNYEYSLTAENIAKLAAEYQADAVFFHYVQVKKSWVTVISGPGFTSASGVTTYPTKTLPMDRIVYLPTLYDRAGSILYGGVRYGAGGQRAAIMNLNGDNLMDLETLTSIDGKDLGIKSKSLDQVMKGVGSLDKHRVLDILNKHWIPMGDEPGGSLAGL